MKESAAVRRQNVEQAETDVRVAERKLGRELKAFTDRVGDNVVQARSSAENFTRQARAVAESINQGMDKVRTQLQKAGNVGRTITEFVSKRMRPMGRRPALTIAVVLAVSLLAFLAFRRGKGRSS